MTVQDPLRTTIPRESLVVPTAVRRSIAEWSYSALPAEACGVLLGVGAESSGARTSSVRLALLGRNLSAASEPPTEGRAGSFTLDPVDLRAAYRRADEEGLEVLGIWHSHPQAPAIPSVRDRTGAWGGWVYLIVATQTAGRARGSSAPVSAAVLRAWRPSSDGFSELELSVR